MWTRFQLWWCVKNLCVFLLHHTFCLFGQRYCFMSLYLFFWIAGVRFSCLSFVWLHLCFTYTGRHLLPYLQLYHFLPYFIVHCLYRPFTLYGNWRGHPPLRWDEEKRWTFCNFNNEWIVVSQVNRWFANSINLFYAQTQPLFVTHTIYYFPLSWTRIWILIIIIIITIIIRFIQYYIFGIIQNSQHKIFQQVSVFYFLIYPDDKYWVIVRWKLAVQSIDI